MKLAFELWVIQILCACGFYLCKAGERKYRLLLNKKTHKPGRRSQTCITYHLYTFMVPKCSLATAAVTFCWHVCFFWGGWFLYAGGPGVHDPCERDPTDVLSDLNPQQADIVTESAQVSHRLLSSSSSSASPAESAVSFCIRSISDMTPGFFCVSVWRRNTCCPVCAHLLST